MSDKEGMVVQIATDPELEKLIVLPIDLENLPLQDQRPAELHGYQWNAELQHVPPPGWVSRMRHSACSMRDVYCFEDPDAKYEVGYYLSELNAEGKKEMRSLRAFFEHKHPEVLEPVGPCMVFEGWVGTLHSMFMRYQIGETSYTYVTRFGDYSAFINYVAENGAEGVDFVFRNNQYWQFGQFQLSSPIELPLAWLNMPDGEHEMDGTFSGDFEVLDRVVAKFGVAFRQKLADATELAQKIGYLVHVKDHDLYLAFKGVDRLTKLNISLDRVFPMLPESGEVSLGDNVLSVDDWKDFHPTIQLQVKRLIVMNKHINRMIDKHQAMLPQRPYILKQWKAELQKQLMASSHFMKVLYHFNAEYGMKLVQDVANDVLTALHEHGGNIGLDLNDWTVYSYEGVHRPTPIQTDDLRFADKLYKRYTSSFIDALYAYLLRCQSPLIKPYTYRESVDPTDGIPIGSIRQVN